MRAQHGLPPYLVGTLLFTPELLSVYSQCTPLTSLLLSQDPRAPPTPKGTEAPGTTKEPSQAATTHPEPTTMGGRKSGVVATKPCSVQIKVSAVSTLFILFGG